MNLLRTDSNTQYFSTDLLRFCCILKMKNLLCTLFCLVVTSIAGIAGEAIPDSLLTEKNIRSLIVAYPDSALRLIDAAENSSNPMARFRAELLRGLAYHELRMFSLQERHARMALTDDSIASVPALRLNALTLLAEAEELSGRFNQSIATWTEALSVARDSGNRPAEMLTIVSMAKTYFAMGNRKEGFNCLSQVIDQGEMSDNVRELANVSYALGVLVLEHYADGNYNEAVNQGWRRMRLIGKIESVGGSPEGYADQQRAYTYARLASSLYMAGDATGAAEAWKGFRSTVFGNTINGGIAAIDYLLASRRWTDVLAVVEPYAQLYEGQDTICEDYYSILKSRADALHGLGRIDQAYSFLSRATVVRDSITARENTRGVREMAEVFAIAEKEQALSEATIQAQRRHDWLVAGGVLLAVVIAFSGVMWYKWRRSERHLHTASARVRGLDVENRALAGQLESMVVDPAKTMDDQERFAALETVVRTRRLFLNPQLNRRMLAEASGLTQAQVSSLIQRNVGESLGNWVTRLKMDYAVELMEKNPNWTMEAVSQELGYASRSTFYQNFNRYYGMTPAEYRRQSGNAPAAPEQGN